MSTTAARRTNVPDYTTAYYFLEGLSEIGIDYLFCNFGTDHAPIIEETSDDERRLQNDAPQLSAFPEQAREDSQPSP